MIFPDKMYIFQRCDLKKVKAAALLIAGLLVFAGCGSTDAQETAADGQESDVDEQETVTDEPEVEVIPKAWETLVIELGDKYTFSEDVADYVSVDDEALYAQMTLDNEVDLTAPGEYEIKVSGFGQEFAFPVVIQDTVYPELEILNAHYLVAAGQEVGVDDLFVRTDDNDKEYVCGYYGTEKVRELEESAIDEVRDNEGLLPTYAQEKLELDDTQILPSIVLTEEGIYQVNAVAVDRSGNATISPIKFIVDGTGPEISLTRESVTVYFDEGIDFGKGVSVKDNVSLPEECFLGLNEEHLNNIGEKFANLEEGTYSVDYYAIDKVGNISYKTLTITLKSRGYGGQGGQSQPVSGPYYDEAMARAAFDEVNQYRAEVGLAALSWSDSLYESCKIRAEEITISFSHTRPNGEMATSMIPGNVWKGENIAYGQRSSHEVAVAWYNSQGHRENMLTGEYTQAAIGCYFENGIYYWVTMFTG